MTYGCKCVPYTQNVDSKKGRGSIVICTRIPLVSKLLLQYVATQIGAKMLEAESREVQKVHSECIVSAVSKSWPSG